jgi:hypothetical protein
VSAVRAGGQVRVHIHGKDHDAMNIVAPSAIIASADAAGEQEHEVVLLSDTCNGVPVSAC